MARGDKTLARTNLPLQADARDARGMAIDVEEILVRDLTFDLERVPEHWHGSSPSITTFFNNLSIFFPAGERFFIASVRAKARHLTDERLLEDVRRFCAQEGIHCREHLAYNEMLERQGYPVAALEKSVDDLLAFAKARLPGSSRLAITCALEHFTALMGFALLGDRRTLEGADPTMANLWRWHAAEENEHKSVAFDVYLASNGTYRNRAAMMVIASVIFWAKVLQHQVIMSRVNPSSSTEGRWTMKSAREWYELFRFLFIEPGGLRPLMRHYLAYYRRDFHPRDVDSAALLEGWRAQTL